MTLPELRPPEAVERIARRLETAGHETWAVGGAIRDALAGEPLGDWDLATGAHPGEVRRIFRRTVPIGVEHGTVGVLAEDGTLYELTTFRRDVRTDGRRAEVEFADRIEDDLSRRDFTINAVAWNPLTGEWLDPSGGVADLEARVLRTVGDPRERFREDWLRVLRALRFAGRFELTIEAGTWDAICAAGDALLSLSAERVREELVKVLGARRPSESLDLYARSGVLRTLFPEIAPASDDQVLRFDRRLRVIDEIVREPVEGRMAALFGLAVAEPPDVEAEVPIVRETMRRLRCSNAETERVGDLIRATLGSRPPTEEVEARRWLSRWGAELLEPAAGIWSAEAHVEADDWAAMEEGIGLLRRVARSGVALSVSDLAIDGHELQRMGLPPGPQYGELLRRLLERVLEEPALNDADSLRALVREWTET